MWREDFTPKEREIEMSDGNLEPYAVDCQSGKYIVVQAFSRGHAMEKVSTEYGQVAVSCRKVE